MRHGRLLLVVAVLAGLGLCRLPVTAAEAAMLEIRSPDGPVIVSNDQIRTYDWTTHTLTLAPGVREQLARRFRKERIVSGVPFAVTVGGKAIYGGSFTTVASSRSFSTPVIVIDEQTLDGKLGADQLRIQLGYPGAGFFKGSDPRTDPRVRQALLESKKLAEPPLDPTDWVAKSLKEMQTIRPGMTRADLLKVFEEEGGISTRTSQRYVYRGCPYFKVDVTFTPVGRLNDRLAKVSKDRIATISRPFLEWTIAD
jgi:hypothetical protein